MKMYLSKVIIPVWAVVQGQLWNNFWPHQKQDMARDRPLLWYGLTIFICSKNKAQSKKLQRWMKCRESWCLEAMNWNKGMQKCQSKRNKALARGADFFGGLQSAENSTSAVLPGQWQLKGRGHQLNSKNRSSVEGREGNKWRRILKAGETLSEG